LDVGIAQDLRFDQDGLRFERADSRALDAFYSCFRSLIGSYLDAVDGSGNGYANLLSGGVDSSLLQLAINENRPGAAARSFSFAVRVPSFETEIANAGRAAAIFGTQHTYVDITEKEFPNLLIRTTQTLAQPVLTSAEVCKLGLAEALSRTTDAPRFVFAAQGADTLFGLQVARKTSILDGLKNIPASTAALTLAGALLKPFSRRGQTLLNLADILSQLHDPDHFAAPLNTEASIVDFTQARRWFGDDAIRRALADRRAKEAAYLDSRNYTEKVHIMELFGDCDQIIVQSGQLFLAHRREQLYPFLDEDGIRLSLAFPPNVRYVRGTRHKYVLKQVLEQRVASAITRQPKGGSMFHADLQRWMKSGSLRDMIQAIDLPAFLGRAEFEQLVERSRLPQSLVLWHLLALDVFKKHVVNSGAAHRK
jgi:asparagine synthetase B (glutamine-hydrolysing)